MDKISEVGRRNVLKKFGSAALGLSLTSSLAGAKRTSDENGMVSAKKAGIQGRYRSLMARNEFEAARRLVHENDVTMRSNTVVYPEDDLSTQDYYGKGASWITSDQMYWDTDQWALNQEWHLRNVQNDIDGPAPHDNAALAYEDDIFGYVSGSVRHSGQVTTNDGTYTNLTSVESEPLTGDNPNAVVVAFDDDWIIDGSAEGDGYMQMVIRRQDENSMGRTAASYAHTWSASNIGGTPLSVNVSLGGLISWDDPFGVDRWVLSNATDI